MPFKKILKTCIYCKKESLMNPSQVYCSRSCSSKNIIPWNKGKNGNNVALGICLNCNKEFIYYLGYTFGKFCCRECYNNYVKIPEKECVVCGKLYVPDKGNKIKWNKSKYCSMECLHKGRITGKYVECSYCKKPKWLNKYREKNSITKKYYCSKSCIALSKKGHSGMKYYKKGYRAEAECRKILENEGYLTIRNFLSWGIFDIVAIGKDHVRFIQVKSSKKYNKLSSYKKDIDNILKFNVPEFATKELWTRIDRHGWKKYLITENIKFLEDEDLSKLNKLSNNEIIIVSERFKDIKPNMINDMIVIIDKKNKDVKFIDCSGKLDLDKYQWLNDEFIIKLSTIIDIEDIDKISEYKYKGGNSK